MVHDGPLVRAGIDSDAWRGHSGGGSAVILRTRQDFVALARSRAAVASAVLLAVVAAAAVRPEQADAGCAPPRCVEHEFDVEWLDEPIQVAVMLPPGYGASERSFPVTYFLHCGGCTPNIVIDALDLEAFTGALPAEQQAIVVLPRVGWGVPGDYRDGSRKWQSFLTRTLIPQIEATYAPSTDRSRRAIAGISVGGLGAMRYASKHPDLFVAAASFSGLVDIRRREPFSQAISYGFLSLGCASAPGCPPSARGVYGDPVADAIWWRDANPPDLAPNLDGVAIYHASGNGVPCDATDALNLRHADGFTPLEGWIGDMNQGFHDALTAADVEHTSNLRPCGIHWPRPHTVNDLADWWPRMVDAFGTPPPASFRHRAATPSFSVWGWSFVADPDRAPEFLDVLAASEAGVMLRGSGTTHVRTAPYFPPGETVSLSGARQASAVAQADGRIEFDVELGAPHGAQQFSPEARVAEVAGGYWTTRSVGFDAP